MSVLFILIGASVLVAAGFLYAFIRSVRSGQYDDQYTPSVRILFDDASTSTTNNQNAGKASMLNQPTTDN